MSKYPYLLSTLAKYISFQSRACPYCRCNETTILQWGQMINEKHLLALTAEFFQRNLPKHGFSTEFSSSPYTKPPTAYEGTWDTQGEELLVIGTLHA